MRLSAVFLLLAVHAITVQTAVAADCAVKTSRCDQCGCHAACTQKTCQVVCDVKKETKKVWYVECKEICPLMPGCRNACNKDSCDQESCGKESCKKCPPPPRCGTPKCVKKLVKKEYQVDVPVYKCVVKSLCSDCCQGEATATDAPASKSSAPSLPAPPPSPK